MSFFRKKTGLSLQLTILLIAGAILAGSSRRISTAEKSVVRYDRTTIIDRAREIAQAIKYDPTGWEARVVTRVLKGDRVALAQANPAPALHYLAPFLYVVYLTNPSTQETMLVEVTSGGVLRRFEYQDKSTGIVPLAGGESRSIPQIEPMEGLRSNETDPLNDFSYIGEMLIVRSVSTILFFNHLSLSDARTVTAPGRIEMDLGVVEKAGTVLMRPSLRFELVGERIRKVDFNPALTPALRELINEDDDWKSVWLRRAQTVLALPMVLLALIFGLSAIAYRRTQARTGLPFWLFLFGVALLSSGGGERLDLLFREVDLRRVSEEMGLAGWFVAPLPWLIWVVWAGLVSFIGYAIGVVGLSISIRTKARRSLGLELLWRGRLITSPVIEGLVYGLIGGVTLTAISYGVHWWIVGGRGAGVRTFFEQTHGLDLFSGRSPAFAALTFHHLLGYLLFFAVIIPLIELYLRPGGSRRILIFGLTVLMVGQLPVIKVGFGPLLITTILLAVVLLVTYQQSGLLSVLAALLTSESLAKGLLLLDQAAPSLRVAGQRVIFGLGLLCFAALIAWRYRRVPTKEELHIPARLLEMTIERERLKADFEVARRAQQSLLPGSSPAVKGYDVAAICLPSREVGGDLYDFITSTSNQIWLVVADVSGKGVPASLYMTLTKGLLTALTERIQDPVDVLRKINQHLYEVCRRRVFVTMVLGLLDTSTHRLVMARAGHNPALLRRAASGETVLLNPRGIGLGLSNSSVFDRALTLESIDLSPGDILIFYSDGITEAMNAQNEEFGIERLISILDQQHLAPAAQIIDAIQVQLAGFLVDLSPQDDQTLLVLKRQ